MKIPHQPVKRPNLAEPQERPTPPSKPASHVTERQRAANAERYVPRPRPRSRR